MPITRLRWAGVADARAIADLWHRVWHLTYGRHLHPDVDRAKLDVDCFQRRVGFSLFEHNSTADEFSPRPTALLAMEGPGGEDGSSSSSSTCKGDNLQGFVIVRGGVEIEHFYLHPDVQGTGLAQRLLANAEHTMLEERGCTVAHLSVASRNLRALRFYEKHGWVPTPPRPWMTTDPWVPVRPLELPVQSALKDAAVEQRGGLTEEELEAMTMRGTRLKKILGYDEPLVPKVRSY